MASNSEYWTKRTLELNEALANRGTEYYHRLEKEYQRAANEVTKEIAVLYSKLAKNNNITSTEARKILTTNELKEFRWKVEEYIERGRENGVDKKWTKQLENASLRARISRLEAMRIQMQNEVENLMGIEVDGVSALMSEIYTEGYYRTGHLLQTGWGIGFNFAQIDTRKVEKVLSSPWVPDGRNFSERIWGVHRPKLVQELQTGLAQSIIRGEKYNKLADRIAEKFGVAKKRAETLVLTEAAYFSSVSQQECYKELEVEQQRFCATLDLRTSEICREMDGRVFDSKDVEIGVNAPPLHCRCRSVMVPYYGDLPSERAARNKDGKTIMVPGDMTYEDWYKNFVENKS